MKIRLGLLNGDVAVRLKIHRSRDFSQLGTNVVKCTH